MPDKDKKVGWISVDGGEDSDLSNLRDEDAELAKHRIELCEQAVATAREKGDRHEEGVALLNLGEASFFLGKLNRAVEHYEQALAISRELSDRHEEANVLSHLGTACEGKRQVTRAIEHREQAIAIYHEIGDRSSEAKELSNLGLLLFMFLGTSEQMGRAIEYLQQALSISREIGDRNHEALTLNNMGAVHLFLGQMEHALQCHEQALAISREIGDRDKEASTLRNLGGDYLRVGQKERALDCYQQALAIFREIGDRDKEAMVLVGMGATYSNLGQVEKAIEITQAAVQILEETGGPGADDARERLDHLYTQKSKKTPRVIAISIGLILVALVAVSRLFNSSTANKYYSNFDISTLRAIQYVSIEELYRNAPVNSTGQKDWKQWENEYSGRYVKGKGKLVSVSIHPQVGKLFFIVTIFGEEGTIKNTTTQVALLVEGAHTMAFGEKEGSFLIDDTRWIYLGENYAFEGTVSKFSLFDAELVSAGYSNLVILKGKMMDITPTSTQTLIPTARAAVPTARATVPTARATVPTARATVPTARAAVPIARATVPIARAAETSIPLTGNTILVSVGQYGARSNGYSVYPAISGDGRYVVFSSEASNLVSDDTNGKSDIFVHDMDTGMTTRVSIASDGTQGNDRSDEPSISGDGRYVAFWSYASNLVPGDTNNRSDVFVHDRDTGLTTRVSVASNGTQANGHSFNSISISRDGNYVAFMSYADNLVPGDTNKAMDVFVRDRKAGVTTRVSVASDGSQSNGGAFIARSSISGDGRYITFSSGASNLVLPDTNSLGDIFVHDRETGTTSRVSVSSDGTQGNSGNGSSIISEDGRYVVFWSLSSNLVPSDTNNIGDIFVHDRETGATSRVSVSSDGTQSSSKRIDTGSVPWSISDDGRYVAFTSEADNLVPGDTNNVMDVFVRDRKAGVTTRVSVASDGTQSNDPSYVCSISGDGKYVAFTSWANNLVPDDKNPLQDIFLHESKNGN